MNTKKKDPRFLRNRNIPVGVTTPVYDAINELAKSKYLSKSKLIEVIIIDYLEREGINVYS